MNYDKHLVDALGSVIEKRRSIKPHSFTGEEIPTKIIEAILASTNWAPSHGKTEPWRFKVYCGKGKALLLEKFKNIYTEITPKEKIRPEKLEKYEVNCHKSSHIVVISMKRQEIEKIPEIEEIEAVACAVQNLHLTASAYGVAGYWSSGAMTYSDYAHETFDLGEKDRLLGFFYLGTPSIEWPEGKRLSDWQSKVEWIY